MSSFGISSYKFFVIQKDKYPPIPFVYQRGETDLEFLNHVLAVAGVFYYFHHASSFLDSLLPGAGEAAALIGGLGGMAGAAGDLSGGAAGGSALGGVGVGVAAGVSGGIGGDAIGALGSVAGIASKIDGELGLLTTMVRNRTANSVVTA